MRNLTLAIALLVGTSAFAETTDTTGTTTATTTTGTTTVSNLNYFVSQKKFNVDTTVGWTTATTELTGFNDTDESGLEFGITGVYGISKATNAGFRVGYTSTEDDDTNEETTGLTDIDLLYNWRFSNTTNAQQDLNFTLSPKLGAKEEDGTETNGYRGSTLVSIDWVYNSKINTNTEWNVAAGIDYYTDEETEDANGTVTDTINSRNDLGVVATIRHHNSEKMFVGGSVGIALPGDLEEDGSNTIELDTEIALNANLGYKINTSSNVVATLGYTTLSGSVANTTTDVDLTTTDINVAYVREF